MPSSSVAVAVRVTGPGAGCDVGETASETLGATFTVEATVTGIVADAPVAPRLSVAIALNW